MTYFALKRRDADVYLASNPDPALGQVRAETSDSAQAVAWTTMTIALANLFFLPDADAFDIVPVTRDEAQEPEIAVLEEAA